MRVRHPYTRQAAWVLFSTLIAWTALAVPASARNKPGPVDERGVATHIAGGKFSLVTAHHGTLVVIVTPDTQVTMTGRRMSLREGDHVGVRGFRSAGAIRAIWIHIYSHAANKPYSLSGTVVSISSGELIVTASGKTQVIAVGKQTSVVIVSRSARLADIRPGDHVRVKVQRHGGGLTAIGIHVFTRPQKHVEVSGTVARVEGVLVTVKTSAGETTVQISPTSVIYLGASRTSIAALQAGQLVRIYACCAGEPLTATSVHIHRSPVHVVSEYLHGTVQRIGAGAIVVLAAGRAVVVVVSAATRYQIASAPAHLSELRIGDEVTILVHERGTRLTAVRVDVPAASRALHTLQGTVVAVSGSVVTVLARGHRYRVTVPGTSTVTLGGRRVAIGALRAGDKVRVTGLLRGTSVAARTVTAVRPLPPVRTVHGTILAVHGRDLIILDSAGSRYTVTIPPGVQATVQGVPSPAAVFPGARVTVKGTVSGPTIRAQRVAVSVSVRDVSGRLLTVTGAAVRLSDLGRTVVVDITGSPSITDRGQRIGPGDLHAGAFAEVHGYAPAGGRLHATSIRVLHPSLDVSGTLAAGSSGYAIHLSTGEVFRLHVTSDTRVTNALKPVSMTIDDVPPGTRVHVSGTVRSDGLLTAASIVARLSSVTLRGTVVSMTADSITVSSGTGSETARIDADVPVTQGSRSLQLTDVVVGDDVTVEGYQARSVVLTRALLVHRSLVGLDGVVQATGRDGITLTTSSGTVRVAVGPDTAVAGTVSIGVSVHVTGYRRGDGVILATRVRVGK